MSTHTTVSELLDEHGSTFADEAGIRLADMPMPLFRLLVLTSLLSANLDPRLGLRTARALGKAGLTTPQRMRDAGDDAVWQVLSDSLYLRKRQTARQLGQLADEVLQRWRGDLRRMRDATDDLAGLRAAIGEFTGIGPLGVDIFCREVQAVWPGLRPYADERVRSLARAHGLPGKTAKLGQAAGTDDLSRLGAALLFADMAERREQPREKGTTGGSEEGQGQRHGQEGQREGGEGGQEEPAQVVQGTGRARQEGREGQEEEVIGLLLAVRPTGVRAANGSTAHGPRRRHAPAQPR